MRAYVEEETARLASAAQNEDPTSYVHLTLAAMLAARHGEAALGQRVLANLGAKLSESPYYDLRQPFQVASCEA